MPWETIRTITASQAAETGDPQDGEYIALKGIGGLAQVKLVNVNITGRAELRFHVYTEGEWSPVYDWPIPFTPTTPIASEYLPVPTDASYQLGVTVKFGTVNTMTVRVNPVMNVYL